MVDTPSNLSPGEKIAFLKKQQKKKGGKQQGIASHIKNI